MQPKYKGLEGRSRCGVHTSQSSIAYTFNERFQTGVTLPPGDMHQCSGTFMVVMTGWAGATGSGLGTGYCSASHDAQDGTQTKNHPTQKASSTKTEKTLL